MKMFIEIDKRYIKPDSCTLPFVLNTVGYNSDQIATDRPDGYIYHHMLWVTEGCGVFTAGGKSFKLKSGRGMFCRRGVAHSYRSDGGRFSTAWVTFTCCSGLLDHYSLPDSFVFDVHPNLKTQFQTLYDSCFEGTVVSRSAAGYLFITDWLENTFKPTLTLEQKVQNYLENNYALPISLDDIAKSVGMSKYSLCHSFKQLDGESVIGRLRAVRIAKAKQLLRQMSLKTEEIGRLCGFENSSYFCKEFKRVTGKTPLEYRGEHKLW